MYDIIIKSGVAVTLNGGVRSGREISLNVIDDCDIGIKDGIIVKISDNLKEQGDVVIDADNKIVMPGFVDSHTHALFGGNRVEEFEMKLQGISYGQIMEEKGGILQTVSKTRDLEREQMIEILNENLSRMVNAGTTTVEVKSGYGLNTYTEMEMLSAMNSFSSDSIELVPTYMGAHQFPPEKSKKEYMDEIINEQIPRVVSNSYSEFCDVFCEKEVFNKEESKEILQTAKDYGLKAKIHADELTCSGGAELAGEMNAISAEHLIYPSEEGLISLSENKVIAVMLPSTSFVLDGEKPPVDRFRDYEIPMALGSDFNPGSSPVSSMPLVMGFGCHHYGMTVEEVVAGATINSAGALDIQHRVGSLEEGKEADILVLKYKDIREIPYWMGENPVMISIKKGRINFERRNN